MEVYLHGIGHWTVLMETHLPVGMVVTSWTQSILDCQESLESQTTWSSLEKLSWSMTEIYSNYLRLTGRMDWFLINWNSNSRNKKYIFWRNSQGIIPDPKKIDSILKMEFPKDKETMHSYLGLINFLNWYSPWFGELCPPLRSVILRDAQYNITEEHWSALAALKNAFRKTVRLQSYHTSTNTKILYYRWMQARKDLVQLFSKQQLSILCLTHTYISRKELPKPQIRVYGSCMGYGEVALLLYGKHFTLQTDQKPLISIFEKHMIDVSLRIQWIAICAWQYQFEPQYNFGKMNVIVDTLSRVTLLDFEEHDVDREVLAVNVLTYTAMHSSMMCTNHFSGCLLWGMSTQGVSAWAGGCLPWGCVCPGLPRLPRIPPCGQTDACENITLPRR